MTSWGHQKCRRRQRTFIDNNDSNKRLQHLGNKPHTLIALVMHNSLVASTRRALSGAGTGTGTPPAPSPSLALVVPAKERTARLACLEAEVAVGVRQIRQHAHADDAGERVPRKVECLEDVEREDERRDVCGERRRWLGEYKVSVSGRPAARRQLTYWIGGRCWCRYRWCRCGWCRCADDGVWLPRKNGAYPIEQSGCADSGR